MVVANLLNAWNVFAKEIVRIGLAFLTLIAKMDITQEEPEDSRQK
jgi:hypothetical protein